VSQAAQRAADVAVLAAEQAGLLSRRQLRQAGVSADVVRNHVAAGRWMCLGRRVVALQTGPLTLDQARWLAVLDGGAGCVLAGLSALHNFGLKGFPIDRIYTAVPHGSRCAETATHVRRSSRRLTPDAVHPAKLPPTMRIEPAILDALDGAATPLTGCALLAAVVQQRLLPAHRLRATLEPALRLRNRALYLSVAGDIEGGAHSLLEIDFGQIARQAGVPPPIAQSRRVDAHGRVRYLDADFGGYACEVDGAVHLRPLAWWDDMFRQNALVIGGKPILRFPAVAIRLRKPQIYQQLRLAHSRWGGEP
jgi:hypothetical protein